MSEFHVQTHHQTAGSGWKQWVEVGSVLEQWTSVWTVGLGLGVGNALQFLLSFAGNLKLL